MKSEWTKKNLSDIADFNPRETIKKGTKAKKIPMDVLHPFYRDIPYYVEECFSGGTKFRNGDTIMARITPCLENGKTAQVSILNDGEVGFGSTEYIVFRAKEGIANKDYLYYLVCSPEVREPAIKSMVGSSGRQRVQTDVVKNLEIDVPPLVDQEKIGSFLKSFDDKITLNDKINKNLEQQAQALFDSLLSVPKYFENITLGSVTTNIRERIGDDEAVVLSAVNVGKLQPSDEFFSKRVYSKDISNYIIVREGNFAYNPARINIGSIGINDLGATGCVSPVYVVFSVDVNYQSFFEFYFKTSAFRAETMLRASGSVRQSLNYSNFALINLKYPNREIAKIFNDFWLDHKATIRQLKSENIKLAELRDTLLPKLMSGELEVSDIDL